MPDTKVLQAPAHGRLEFVRELAYPRASGELERCNARKVPSSVAYYTAAPGYAGKDKIVIRVSFSDHVDENTINITVVN